MEGKKLHVIRECFSAEDGPPLRPLHPLAEMLAARKLKERLPEEERLLG
jgi:hypothetical protein